MKSREAEIIKLTKTLDRLERKMAKLQEKSIPYNRLMKSYIAKEKKLRALAGAPERIDIQDAPEDKNLEDIPEEAW